MNALSVKLHIVTQTNFAWNFSGYAYMLGILCTVLANMIDNVPKYYASRVRANVCVCVGWG